MNTNPIAFATQAKGPLALLRRAREISRRYGLTPANTDRTLDLFVQTLSQFNCGASFPLTAVALERNIDTIARYLDQDIEFAVHGHTHIDYSQLEPDCMLAHVQRAQEIFAEAGIRAVGFRSPYLRRSDHLYAAIEGAGFSYSSNQPISWDVLDDEDLDLSTHSGYQRAIAFYDAWDAGKRPSLPQLRGRLVEIPVSLPDDEILLDRLDGESNGLVEKAWKRILAESYHLGELFTLQLHPERIARCVNDLSAVLAEARRLTPSVWIARLDEVATWWQAREDTTIEVKEIGDDTWHLSISGPPGTTILARDMETVEPTEPWTDDYTRIISTRLNEAQATTCIVKADCRPFIGVSPACSPTMVGFLRQQGYVVQVSEDSRPYSVYLDQPHFAAEDERPLLAQIENRAGPLVRLGRWPDGARSALCVTGDIDALTLWDYGLRLFGK